MKMNYSWLRTIFMRFVHCDNHFFHFISAVHIWFISCINNTHFFQGNIWTHNLPAPNVSGFIGQLVEHRTGKSWGHGFKPRWSPEFFQASLRNCIKCVHCDDHFFISYLSSSKVLKEIQRKLIFNESVGKSDKGPSFLYP